MCFNRVHDCLRTRMVDADISGEGMELRRPFRRQGLGLL